VNNVDSDAALFVACFCVLGEAGPELAGGAEECLEQDACTAAVASSLETWLACLPAAKSAATVEQLAMVLARFPVERAAAGFARAAASNGLLKLPRAFDVLCHVARLKPGFARAACLGPQRLLDPGAPMATRQFSFACLACLISKARKGELPEMLDALSEWGEAAEAFLCTEAHGAVSDALVAAALKELAELLDGGDQGRVEDEEDDNDDDGDDDNNV
jgi:hypothetical protein